jgi:hypothetical protein
LTNTKLSVFSVHYVLCDLCIYVLYAIQFHFWNVLHPSNGLLLLRNVKVYGLWDIANYSRFTKSDGQKGICRCGVNASEMLWLVLNPFKDEIQNHLFKSCKRARCSLS